MSGDPVASLLGASVGAWRGRVIALLGSGGKTSLLQTLARELSAVHERVLLSTSTKVYPVPGIPSVERPEDLPAAFAVSRAVFLGRKVGDEGKLGGDPTLSVSELRGMADCVLLEGDGARRRPFKVHLPHDPVLDPTVDLAIVIAGARAVGVPAEEDTVHRIGRAPAHWGLRAGEPLTPELMARVLLAPDGYAGKAGPVPVRYLINQADEAPAAAAALASALSARWPGPVLTGSARAARFELASVSGAGVSLVLLAAGNAERFGSDKRRLRLAGRSLLEWSLRAYRDARLLERIAVIGPGEEDLAELVLAAGFRPVLCADPSLGQSASLQAGLAAVNRAAAGMLVALGDMPAILPSSARAIALAASGAPERALRPVHAGKPGHPVYLPRSCFADLARLRGDAGARSLLPALDPFPLECADPGVILDLDRSDQFAHMESLLSREPENDAF